MPISSSKFRIGLLLDSTIVSKYVFEFIKWAQNHQEIAIVATLCIDRGSQSFLSRQQVWPAAPRASISKLLFRWVCAIERHLLLRNKRHRSHLQEFDASSLLNQITPLDQIKVVELGQAQLDIDVWIVFATDEKISREALDAKFGSLFISQADDRFYRGGPPGFWEVYRREDVTGFTIRHVAPQDHPGDRLSNTSEVLLRGRTTTQFYYLLNQACLFEKSFYYLARIVEKIAQTRQVPKPEDDLPFSGAPRTLPRADQTCIYLLGLLRLLSLKTLQKLRGFDFRWHVGFVFTGWKEAQFWKSGVIKNTPGRYLADPFVITRDGVDFCFVEDYDERAKRARIAVYELAPNGARYVGIAIEERFHLSYPYLFEYQHNLYMCPETSEQREIRIYKCITFPLRWQLQSVIMKDVAAVDTILFEHDDKWWMLTNVDPARWDDYSLELHLFWAQSPLEQSWNSHPLNPLIIDAARGRNGGMVWDGNRLFRIAQGQGFGMYGKRALVNEIVVLNETDYREECIGTISPTFRRGISGTHHLHSNGRVTVFDFADGAHSFNASP
jgi:hypothetical protein